MNCRRCKTTENLITIKRPTFNSTKKLEYACQPCIDISKRIERNRGTLKYTLPISDSLAEIIERGKQSNSRLARKYRDNVYSH